MTHFFCKTAHCVQYQSSFFHVSIPKIYTWLFFFTQPAVVMVVTNMKYVDIIISQKVPNILQMSVDCNTIKIPYAKDSDIG